MTEWQAGKWAVIYFVFSGPLALNPLFPNYVERKNFPEFVRRT